MTRKNLFAFMMFLTIFYMAEICSAQFFYHINDHLGNTRVVLDDQGNVKEYYDYYPFGKILRSSVVAEAVATYKFTGKELDDENDLNWYYFGARYYDAKVGRWMTVDPLTEKYPQYSPFIYCFDNPLIFFDSDGERPWLAKEGKQLLAALQKADFQYFSEWGKGLRMNDKGNYATNWPPTLNIPIKGITTYEKMNKTNKIKVTLQIALEFAKSLNPISNSDPRRNSITGTDPLFGGQINFDIREDLTENAITDILIGDKGGKNVVIYYVGTDKSGKILYLVSRTFIREEYNKWREEMDKIKDESRQKEIDNENNNDEL